jgi:hypothetical protein
MHQDVYDRCNVTMYEVKKGYVKALLRKECRVRSSN